MPYKDKETARAKSRAYREAHREEINAKSLAYREAHREERKAYNEAHREEIKAKSLAYREQNRKALEIGRMLLATEVIKEEIKKRAI